MISMSNNKIRLEKIVIDLSELQIRKKTTNEDLERHYDSFIEHTNEIADYFEDKTLFEKCVNDAAKEKRPKLIARDPKYPFLWFFRSAYMPFDFLEPQKRRLRDEYFMVAKCITAIPTKKSTGGRHIDGKLREDIHEKFKQYPGYECIIQIPNDTTQAQTKESTFHESTHYLVLRYLVEKETNLSEKFIKKEASTTDKYIGEHILQERLTEIMTDKMLSHDKDALFERRWTFYSLHRGGLKPLIMTASALAIGALAGSSITNPYLIPTIFIPGRIRDYAMKKYRERKKEELTKPVEYPEFKI